MKNISPFYTVFATGVAYFFTVLFSYAAVSKMLDFENFQVQLAQSPLLSAYAGFISYGVIIVEVVIAATLAFPKGRKIGLYASFGLMVAFTVYIYLILNYSDFVPCSCGGILEKMGWTEHLIFNGCCVALAILTIALAEKQGDRRWLKTAFVSCLVVIISAGGMVALFLSSEQIMKKENNFIRRFPQHPIVEEARYNLQVNSYYFAGWDADRLFLGNSTSPLLLTVLTQNFDRKHGTVIQLEPDQMLFTAPRIQVRMPFFYLYDGAVPVIYRGKVGNTARVERLSKDDAYFNQFVVIDSARFAIRVVMSKPKHFALGKMQAEKKQKFILYDQLLKKDVESMFEMDGWMTSDPSNSDLLYVFSYHNKFMIIDSSMTQKKEFNTIDTTKISTINIKVLKNGDKRLLSPPPIVNKKSTVFNGVLFIESNVRGKFESKKSLKNTSVVDMYSTRKQEYLGSFYLYHRGISQLTDFMITDKNLFVLTGAEVVRYRLNQLIINHFLTGKAENLKQSRH